MRHRLVLTVLAATFVLGGAASARTPSPVSGASPAPSLVPSSPEALPPFEPNGPPDAITRQHGITVRLWLASPTVAPGEAARAVVRITNDGDRSAWASTGPCLRRVAMVSDITGIVDAGETLQGNGAAFKELLLREAGLDAVAWGRTGSAAVPLATGVRVGALADCGPTGRTFDRVGPGRTLEQRWSWVPGDPLDRDGAWDRPLPPGTVVVAYTWLHAGRGTRTEVESTARGSVPVTVTAELQIAGTDPGSLSVAGLADRALDDPDFAAWVEADPTRLDWAGVIVTAWPDLDAVVSLPVNPSGLAPHGVVEIGLTRDLPGRPGVTGSAWVDPWTGDVLAVGFQCGPRSCPLDLASDGALPTPSSLPSVWVAR